MKHNRFSNLNTLCNCLVCGKRTHSSIDGDLDIQLCRKCYDEANMENEHSDGHHDDKPNPKCIDCQKKLSQIV